MFLSLHVVGKLIPFSHRCWQVSAKFLSSADTGPAVDQLYSQAWGQRLGRDALALTGTKGKVHD